MRFLNKIFVLLLTSTICFAGNEGGNGGDSYGEEFESLGHELIKSMNSPAYQLILEKWKLTPELLEDTIKMVILRSSEEAALGGFDVDGINYNDGQPMVISRSRWRQNNLLQKLKIVLHEYFGVLKIEINHYTASSEFSDMIRETYIRIKRSNEELNLDYYYGYKQVMSPLSAGVICDKTSKEFTDKLVAAQTLAINDCESNNKICVIKNVDIKDVISTKAIGLKYCEITAVAVRKTN